MTDDEFDDLYARPITRLTPRKRERATTLSELQLKRDIRRERREAMEAGHLALYERVLASDLEAFALEPKPKTRGECLPGGRNEARPCPYASCRHHIYIASARSSLTFTFPGLEPGDLAETCALDVAARGGITLEETGAVLGFSRERARQVEVMAKRKLAGATGGQLGLSPERRSNDDP